MSRRPNFDSQQKLVDYLWNKKIILHEQIKNAMNMVDRKDFTDKNPYQDAPQTIGYNVTISAPHMHARALNDLFYQLQPGMKALDIGSGSGYLLAAMAYLVGSTGKVIGIEHMYGLSKKSVENIMKNHSDLLWDENIEVFYGDGRYGYSPGAPYDAIHVGAASSKDVVERLCKQLKKGGKLVIPVQVTDNKQTFREYNKGQDGTITFKNITDVRYVPLTSQKKQRTKNKI